MKIKSKVPTNMNKAKKPCLSGPIIRSLRKQQEGEIRNVTCPMCNSLVLYKNINHHLDNFCQKQSKDTSESLGKSSLSSGESKCQILRLGILGLETAAAILFQLQLASQARPLLKR